MEIITGVERRRRWSAAEKQRIVAETEQPGVGIAEIARRYEISRGVNGHSISRDDLTIMRSVNQVNSVRDADWRSERSGHR
jgi:hypothetical protein